MIVGEGPASVHPSLITEWTVARYEDMVWTGQRFILAFVLYDCIIVFG